jgi:type IV secretory pathway VirB2 component (pilin)
MYSSIIQSGPSFAFLDKRLLWTGVSTLILALFLSDAFAVNSDDPLGDRLCAILGIMMGPTAKAIATIAVIFVAIGLFAGRMTWLTVIPIIIGIIVIFSAPALVAFISGTGNTQCSTT